VWADEAHDFEDIVKQQHSKGFLTVNAFKNFWPRLTATSFTWIANDFAFYGNKLFQSTFIALMHPT
jgi:hypothetical protein